MISRLQRSMIVARKSFRPFQASSVKSETRDPTGKVRQDAQEEVPGTPS